MQTFNNKKMQSILIAFGENVKCIHFIIVTILYLFFIFFSSVYLLNSIVILNIYVYDLTEILHICVHCNEIEISMLRK